MVEGDLLFTKDITFSSIKDNFQQYLYGSITLAILAGTLCGLLTWILLATVPEKCKNRSLK